MTCPRAPFPLLRITPVLLGLSLVVAGCSREQVTAYDAPKDATHQHQAPAGHGGDAGDMASQMPPRPGLEWASLPAGWTSKGSAGMRVANFAVAGTNDASADLAVIPLPGTGGSDLELVNLWRGQLSLSPIAEDALASHTEETSVAGQPVRLFSIVGSGSADASAAGNQILVATLRKDGFTWFFKLGGDAATVAANREQLKTFLAGIKITAPAESDPAAGAPSTPALPPFASAGAAAASGDGGTPSGPPPTPNLQAPAGWTVQKTPQMVLHKWSVGKAGATADITVSVFPGDTGGLIPNLNRWRSQVGLKPAPEPELNALVDNLDVLGGKATLVDFEGSGPESGNSMRIVAAVVKRDGYSFFYKLLGAPAAVAAEREAFVKFIQTAQYSSSRGA